MSLFKSAISANIVALAFIGTQAGAVATVHSSSYGVKADLKVLRNTLVATAAVAPVSGSAGTAYDKTATVAGISSTTKLVDGFLLDAFATIKTGVITDTASSNYPATVGASASSTVNGLGVSFTTRLLTAVPLVSLGVAGQTITSTTSVGANHLGLYSTGSSTLTGLGINGSLLGALNINGATYLNATPNTEIRLAGLTIILNEQNETRSGTTDIFRYTNAINIKLTDYVLAGSVVTGNIIIGHSEAGITGYVAPPPHVPAVPEPATWGMMIAGFGLIGAALRRRKEVAATA